MSVEIQVSPARGGAYVRSWLEAKRGAFVSERADNSTGFIIVTTEDACLRRLPGRDANV